MELKEFVKEVLVQLSEAVVETQEKVKDKGAVVNPQGYNGGSTIVNVVSNPITVINFEVVLTNTGTSEKSAGIGVYLGSVGAGGKVKNETSNKDITRISFSIPAALPNFKI